MQAVLQPGSKAGFYTQKSPKMLLLEWTQQQKRLKPRYKTLRTEEGSFRCKVCAKRNTRVLTLHQAGLDCSTCTAALHGPGRQGGACSLAAGPAWWAANAHCSQAGRAAGDLHLISNTPASRYSLLCIRCGMQELALASSVHCFKPDT